MTEPSVLEAIAITAGVCGTIGVAGVAATGGVSMLMINTLELYTDRKRKYETQQIEQQRGKVANDSLVAKPSFYRALCDAYKFETAYVLSCGRTNTTNWDFEKGCKVVRA